MAVTREEIVEALKEMPALELSELVKELEEVFGVSRCSCYGCRRCWRSCWRCRCCRREV